MNNAELVRQAESFGLAGEGDERDVDAIAMAIRQRAAGGDEKAMAFCRIKKIDFMPAEPLAIAKPTAPPVETPEEIAYTLDNVTACITHFNRPDDLRKLKASLQRYYPTLKVIDLGTGGNLSAARNTLALQCETEFYFMLEEDIELRSSGVIEPLLNVLAHDRSIHGVGTRLANPDGEVFWRHDFDYFQGRALLRRSRRDPKVTAEGTVYYPCDSITNVGLFRTDVLQTVPWRESLPLSEHEPFYSDVKSRLFGSFAAVDVLLHHYRSRPNDEYNAARSRAITLRSAAAKAMRVDSLMVRHSEPEKSVIVLGAGRSGTSVTSKILGMLGWDLIDQDDEWGESPVGREINDERFSSGKLPPLKARSFLRSLEGKWVWKDPRLVPYLEDWLPYISELDEKPTLLWIRRDEDAMARSFAAAGWKVGNGRFAPGTRGMTISEMMLEAERVFDKWPWAKIGPIEIEDVNAAVKMFEVDRCL